jgi:hypothetical protein
MGMYRPELMEAVTASVRMDALCAFIEFWLGPRQPSYGESAEALSQRSLAMPLRRLYEFAGRWPSGKALGPVDHLVPALSHNEDLASLHGLEAREDGRIGFAGDEHAMGEYRTLPSGDDPPVWFHLEYPKESKERVRKEEFVCDSLSRFLVMFVLRQLARSSRHFLQDDGLSARFATERDAALLIWTAELPVWFGREEPYRHRHDFYLWRGVLVISVMDRVTFAANHPEGIRFLNENQGQVFEIRLGVQSWGLSIRPDGSARLDSWLKGAEEFAEAPAGTFDFPDLLATLAARSSDVGDRERDVMVSLPRRGQQWVLWKDIDDDELITSLFRLALTNATSSSKTLEQTFATRWPL